MSRACFGWRYRWSYRNCQWELQARMFWLFGLAGYDRPPSVLPMPRVCSLTGLERPPVFLTKAPLLPPVPKVVR
jgi:hypothetical protein